jgi:hypothetical protein
MLLPIVLLLASAAPAQQTDVAVPAEQTAISEQNHGAISNPEPNTFLRGKPRHRNSGDEGIIVQKNPCIADGTCKTGCLSITAYVFSDGENPQLKYVTDCPNLDVPFQTKRAQHHETNTEQQPALKRTKD